MAAVQTDGTTSLRSRPEPSIVFNNLPNQLHHGVYISRSVAVIALPIFACGDDAWVPLGKRSSKVSDSGMESLICGYLDYNETADQAIVREAWEELGLDLRELLGTQPYEVMSDPHRDARQNVGLRFRMFKQVEELPELFSCDEVDGARWVRVEEAVKQALAFQHDRLIAESLDWIALKIQSPQVVKMPDRNTPEWHMRHRI